MENLSRDPDQQYFADGLTDALITDLAKSGGVRITSRTSVMQYLGTKKTIKEIGRELNVDAVVEGTVTHAGRRVRVTAQLIQVSTDMHLWADAYERDVSEILDLQRALATEIARRIDIFLKPLDRERAVNPEAYGLYLKGRYAFYQYTNRGWQEAIQDFNEAIAIDPGFAPAQAGLAETYVVAGAYGAIPTDEALTRSKAAAAKALQLDDALASAHYALATAHAWYDWDWAGAEQEFRRGLDLNPQDPLGRNWHGGYLSLLGRHDEAIAEHERAQELDPLSLIVNANLTRALLLGPALRRRNRPGPENARAGSRLRRRALLAGRLAPAHGTVRRSRGAAPIRLRSRPGANHRPHVPARRLPGPPSRERRDVQAGRLPHHGCPVLRTDR